MDGNGLYYGEIKKRVKNVNVTCVAKFSYEGFYGWVSIHKMITDSGELLVYRGSSSGLELDEYESGTIAFTPKEHTEYEGVKQTMILRIKTS